MRLSEFINELVALSAVTPGDPDVVVYDLNEDVNLGTPVPALMFRDENGGLWQSVQDAGDNADLADADCESEEVPVTGELTLVAALRLAV